MFTFIRVGFEPEIYLEDYGIYYADTMEPFITNDYYNDEGYDMSIVPVISIDRKGYAVELFDFAYDDVLPSDKPKLIKAILELVCDELIPGLPPPIEDPVDPNDT